MAAADREYYDLASESLLTRAANFQFFAKKGITLTNLVALTHTSEPNYMAVAGGYALTMSHLISTMLTSTVTTLVFLLTPSLRSPRTFQPSLTCSRIEESRGLSTSRTCPIPATRATTGSTRRPAPTTTFASTSESLSAFRYSFC
jgi:hypothetical protein